MRRYTSSEEDSARWEGFGFRAGDIVVSTRSKHGTTWVQAILLMLIHGCPDLPAPLALLSPWLDHTVEPLETVLARLDAQEHRRVIKTHTPLDGLPVDRRATYVVVARHPLDAAVSLYRQGDNIDRERLRALTGQEQPSVSRPPLDVWLRAWIDEPADPLERPDSLPGVLAHLTGAWDRRGEPNVVLVHYTDLRADLEGHMRGLAARLDLEVPEGLWDVLVEAATLEGMRRRAEQLVPDAVNILRDPQAFFRQGESGAGEALLDPAAVRRYHERAAALAPPDLLAWLHR